MQAPTARTTVFESMPVPFGLVETLTIACVVAVLIPRKENLSWMRREIV